MLVELSVVEQRYHAVMEVLAAGVPVVEVAERYGVSRKTVHTWLNRYRHGGLAGLADRSHRPHAHPWQVPAAVEVAIGDLRRAHPRWGPRRLLSSWNERGARARYRRVRRSIGCWCAMTWSPCAGTGMFAMFHCP